MSGSGPLEYVVQRHGAVDGSKPSFKVGDKARVLKGRAANPPTREWQVSAGFDKFYACKEPTQRKNRKPITWKHESVGDRSTGIARVPKPESKEDVPRGKAVRAPLERGTPRNRARRWFKEPRSDVSLGPHFDRKARVLDSTGRRRAEGNSKSWEFHELYGRLKQFGGKRSKAWCHGIFPSQKNYPPSHDKDGKWIDYSLQQYGGSLCDRGLRIEEEAVPSPRHLDKRGADPRGAVQRYRTQRKVDAINAGSAALADFTTRRFRPVSVPRAASRGGSRGGSQGASRGAAAARPATRSGSAAAGPSWRDAKLASLRAELNSLRAVGNQ